MEKFVVTVQRQFGSMGRRIARRMSELLGVRYYDREIVDAAAEKLNLPVSTVRDEEEKAEQQPRSAFSIMQYPLGKGTSDTQDKIFAVQKNIIRMCAKEGNCVIVGRCADFILSDLDSAMHIYIYAPYETRVRRCVEELKFSEEEARHMIREIDKARRCYHMHYAGCLADDTRYKDILIDSSFLGVEGTAEYLADAVRRKFGSEQD